MYSIASLSPEQVKHFQECLENYKALKGHYSPAQQGWLIGQFLQHGKAVIMCMIDSAVLLEITRPTDLAMLAQIIRQYGADKVSFTINHVFPSEKWHSLGALEGYLTGKLKRKTFTTENGAPIGGPVPMKDRRAQGIYNKKQAADWLRDKGYKSEQLVEFFEWHSEMSEPCGADMKPKPLLKLKGATQ